MYSFGVNQPYQLLIYTNTGTNDIFDVSSLAHDIEHMTFLHGQPGKLTFTLEKDPNNILEISNGSAVSFRYDNQNVFFGYVFNVGTDRSEAYSVTAYDKLRYFANHDYFNCVDMSLVDVFTTICTRAKLGNPLIVTSFGEKKIRDRHFVDASYFDMIDYAIDDYLKMYNGKNTLFFEYAIESDIYTKENSMTSKGRHNYLFFVRDNFGNLELQEVSEKYESDSKKNNGALVIGTKSLLTDYKYEIGIDSNTYTQIMAMVDSKEKTKDEDGKSKTLKTCAAVKPDKDSDLSFFEAQERYGVLRKIVNIKNGFEEDKNFQFKLDNYCKAFLELHGKPSKTVKLEALGVTGLNAGDCFVFQLDKLNMKQSVYITSAVHHYRANHHTMSLEIAALDSMPETLGRM